MRSEPDIAKLMADPARALELPPDEAARLLAQLEGLAAVARVAAATRLAMPVGSEATPTPDRLLGVAEAAQLLGLTPKALYARASKLPFTRRLGRGTLRFSLAGAQAWMAAETPRSARRMRDAIFSSRA